MPCSTFRAVGRRGLDRFAGGGRRELLGCLRRGIKFLVVIMQLKSSYAFMFSKRIGGHVIVVTQSVRMDMKTFEPPPPGKWCRSGPPRHRHRICPTQPCSFLSRKLRFTVMILSVCRNSYMNSCLVFLCMQSYSRS